MHFAIYILFKFVVLVLFAAAIYKFFTLCFDPCRLPGPWGLPFVGYIPFLGEKPHITFTELAKKYGDVYQVQLGARRVVMLNSNKAVKDVLTRNEFAGRPPVASYQLYQDSQISSFMFQDFNDVQQMRRKASIEALGYFLSSTNSTKVEELIAETNAKLFQKLSDLNSQPFDPKNYLLEIISEMFGKLCFGSAGGATITQYMMNREKLKEKKAAAFGMSAFLSPTFIADYFPVGISIIPNYAQLWQSQCQRLHSFGQCMIDIIKGHVINEDPSDILDVLKIIISKKAINDHNNNSQSNDLLNGSIDLLIGGLVAIQKQTYVALKILGALPEIQEKIYHEIIQICGPEGKEVTIDHKQQMPYTVAFVNETLRFFPQDVFVVARWATQDTTINGYFIPKGTIVWPNCWACKLDEQMWKNGDAFEVERFLHKDGELDKVACNNLMTFGLGKRRCIGDTLGKLQLFLLIANIVQRFQITLVSFEGDDPFDHIAGHTLQPKTATFKFEKRV